MTAAAYIARERDRFVDEWRALCRIPSVSGSPAIADAADWIEARMRPLFDRVERIELDGHGPLLLGELDGTGPGRLLMYSHYDVVPPGDGWTSPPFAAEVRDGRVYARGACDDKADVTARLQALEACRSSLAGPPPFTLIWLCDPAEEIGSPGLAEALAAHADRLRADACLWESFLRGDDGRPGIGFGCRGVLAVELTLRLQSADQHTAFASVLRSAPLELAQALTSLAALAIPGVREPTEAERRAAAAVPLPAEGLAPGASGERLVFAPSMSIVQLTAGKGDAAPAEAKTRVRFGLVPDQEPDAALDAVRAHLYRTGIEIAVDHAVPPARAPIDTPFATATIDAARDAFGEPVVYPVLIGAGPGRMVLDLLGAPTVSPAGTLRPAGNLHAPDEHGAIEDYLDHVRFTARLLELVAERGL